MKKILILGGGTAGTMMANKLRNALSRDEWNITIVDRDKYHYYQPGFLFIPFGTYKLPDIVKPKADFIPMGVDFIVSEIEKILPGKNQVVLKEEGRILTYDYLLIATGAKVSPDETPGLTGALWNKSIFEFYTPQGAQKLYEFFKTWEGGTLVMSIAEQPIKCPVAPLEFVFLADAFFTERGMRDKVEIVYVTPLSGAFTKPRASRMLGGLLQEKNIKVVTDFYIEKVDNANKKIISYDGQEVTFDVMTIVPVNMGDEVVIKSGLADDLGFIPTDKHTLRSLQYQNVFILGDASNIPTSKAGSAAHFSSEILFENMMSAFENRPLLAKFDGHTNCYIETGFGKGSLIDFNYETEPLSGTFPLPGIGPFGLLKNSKMNHYGKIMFRWMYWHILLKGKEMPIDSHMTMAGKCKQC